MLRELQGKRSQSKFVIMEALSKEYGWTPEQIRSLTVEEFGEYLNIISARNQIEQVKAKRK